MRKVREAQEKKDAEDCKQKAQDDLAARVRDAARRKEEAARLAEEEAAARRLKWRLWLRACMKARQDVASLSSDVKGNWTELQRIQRETKAANQRRMQRIADRRIAPVVTRYTELAAAIQDWTSEVGAVRARHAERARKVKQLRCQRADAVSALRSTFAEIRDAISGECQRRDQEKSKLEDEFKDILDEIKAATKSMQLARALRAEGRRTLAKWKNVAYGYLTIAFETCGTLAAATNQLKKGLEQSEAYLTLLEQASSAVQHTSSLNFPPTVRQRLVLVEDQYGHLIPDVDRLICQPRRRMQISLEARLESFQSDTLEMAKLAHDLNLILEKSRYLGFNTKEGSLRTHILEIDHRLTREIVDTRELLKGLRRSWEARERSSAFQTRKEKARAAAHAYRTCEMLAIRMKYISVYMRPDFNGLSQRYMLIMNLEKADLSAMRTERIMSLMHKASRYVTSSNQLVIEYETLLGKHGFQFAPSHLADSRRGILKDLHGYSTFWRSVRVIIDGLDDVVSRRSEELAKSGELEHIRKHLVQYTEARLRKSWEPHSFFEIYDPSIAPPYVLKSFMEMWPEQHLDTGRDLVLGLVKNTLESMKRASPAKKVHLQRIRLQYEKILRWGKEFASNPTRKVPKWLEWAGREFPRLYFLDKSAVKKIRVSESRKLWFSHKLYRLAPGSEGINLPRRPSSSYHENAASGADSIKNLRGKFIGFDMRWNQDATPKDGPHANASLIMLAREANIDIFHLARHPTRDGRVEIAEEMVTILESPTVIKVCVDAREKCNRLRDYLGVNPQGFLDLEDVHHGLQELRLDRPVPRQPLSFNDLTIKHLRCSLHARVLDNTIDFTQPLHRSTRRSMEDSVYACVALWHEMNKKGQARQLADQMVSAHPLNEDSTRTLSSMDANETGDDLPGNAAENLSQEDPSRDTEGTGAAESNGKEEEAEPAEKDKAPSSSSRSRAKARRKASAVAGTRGDFWAQQKPKSRPHQRKDIKKIPDVVPEDKRDPPPIPDRIVTVAVEGSDEGGEGRVDEREGGWRGEREVGSKSERLEESDCVMGTKDEPEVESKSVKLEESDGMMEMKGEPEMDSKSMKLEGSERLESKKLEESDGVMEIKDKPEVEFKSVKLEGSDIVMGLKDEQKVEFKSVKLEGSGCVTGLKDEQEVEFKRVQLDREAVDDKRENVPVRYIRISNGRMSETR
ncbi:hypothetical protein SLS56_002501 [Neofusicoccum ribis]|uniref:Uncharacterized protein n=1 Tax=Neofusicoccum ribis TaxID=45134 RepID=A0ABR3T3X1_9PEZI